MKPAPPDPAEILLRVRQQLILAQVRIMELEDSRDESRALLGDSAVLLRSTQALADQKLDEAAQRQQRVAQLDAELRALKSSRSWRWTAWLRALERTLGGKQP
jgi:hypothetical protein